MRRAQVTLWTDEMLSEAPDVQAYRGSSLRAYYIAFEINCGIRIADFGREIEGPIRQATRADSVHALILAHVRERVCVRSLTAVGGHIQVCEAFRQISASSSAFLSNSLLPSSSNDWMWTSGCQGVVAISGERRSCVAGDFSDTRPQGHAGVL